MRGRGPSERAATGGIMKGVFIVLSEGREGVAGKGSNPEEPDGGHFGPAPGPRSIRPGFEVHPPRVRDRPGPGALIDRVMNRVMNRRCR